MPGEGTGCAVPAAGSGIIRMMGIPPRQVSLAPAVSLSQKSDTQQDCSSSLRRHRSAE
jgi:hypothetical protein